MFEAWARYRRQFRAVWDCVSEGMDGKEVGAALWTLPSCPMLCVSDNACPLGVLLGGTLQPAQPQRCARPVPPPSRAPPQAPSL